MATESGQERSSCVSRVIRAPRRAIYAAFLDPEALVIRRRPGTVKGQIYEFDAREGGRYRMSLACVGSDRAWPGANGGRRAAHPRDLKREHRSHPGEPVAPPLTTT